jgi:hypothetical protein
VQLDTGYATNGMRIRFHFTSDDVITASGWYIDDVQLTYVAPLQCEPHAGGLVVGNIVHSQTTQPLDDVLVSSDQHQTISRRVLLDGHIVNEGYYSLFLPAGAHTLTATPHNTAAAVNQPVTVAPGGIVRRDFQLFQGGKYISYVPLLIE